MGNYCPDCDEITEGQTFGVCEFCRQHILQEEKEPK